MLEFWGGGILVILKIFTGFFFFFWVILKVQDYFSLCSFIDLVLLKGWGFESERECVILFFVNKKMILVEV